MEEIKTTIKNWLYFVFLLAGIALVGFLAAGSSQPEVEPELGTSIPGGQWAIYDAFSGYTTNIDPSKIGNGDHPQGQNTFINDGDRIAVRNLGYEIFPAGTTAVTTTNQVHSLHTFRRRSGENVLMRGYSTLLEWYDESEDTWENLNSGYTDGAEFGFADYNINTDLKSYTYFGNAQEDFSRWTGANTNLDGALAGGEATITVDDTTGFNATGTLRICSTDVSYTGLTATTFTGVTGAAACDDNRGVTQAVETFPANPKGNIYLVSSNRIFIAGVTSTPQAVYFSQYGDATDYLTQDLVTDGTAEDSGIFNLGEGGGGVTAMVQDENSVYIFKRSIIYKATLTDGLYSIVPLKPFDGKSQTTGAINQKTVFAGGNGIFFITPDNQIMNLARVEDVDYPQIVPVSRVIKPTIDAAVFDDGTGIVWKNKAYFAGKTNDDSNDNDVVFVWNIETNAWESPIVGWNVGDFVIYNDGTGENLYFGHAIQSNTYQTTDTALDDIYGVTANWRSKQYTFSGYFNGADVLQKEVDNVFVEGYITDNTDLTISLLLDEGGFTQIYQTTFEGTETEYLYSEADYNVFGFNVFGTERFGTNDDFSVKKKFRIYLNKDFRRVPFYSAQLEFASDQEGADWEVTRYGFLIREHSQSQDRSLYRSFK